MSCKGHHDCDDDQATTLTLRFGGKVLNFKIYGGFTFEPLGPSLAKIGNI